MEIEEVKTWQWILAGLIAGLLFSCVVAVNGPGYDSQPRDTIEAGEFENAAYATTKFRDFARFGHGNFWQIQANIEKYHKDPNTQNILPRLRYLTVHPPVSSDPEHRDWVTGESYAIGYRPKAGGGEEMFEEWKPFKYGAKVPYEPGYTQHFRNKLPGGAAMEAELTDLRKQLGGKDSFANVTEFLKAAQKLPNANLDFRQAWWERPAAVWSLPPVTGFLFIGVAWPLGLSILQNFGMAKVASPRKKPVPVTPLDDFKIPEVSGVRLAPAAPPPPPPPPPTGEDRKYGGEFYPVVKATHHEEAVIANPATSAKPKAAAAPKPPAPPKPPAAIKPAAPVKPAAPAAKSK